jgi:hypothetical protein
MSIFTDEGYKNRDEYLRMMAKEFGLEFTKVKNLASGISDEDVMYDLPAMLESQISDLLDDDEDDDLVEDTWEKAYDALVAATMEKYGIV